MVYCYNAYLTNSMSIVYRDTATPTPFLDHLNIPNDDGSAAKYGKPDHVYMDAMGFGMGSNCLQVGE